MLALILSPLLILAFIAGAAWQAHRIPRMLARLSDSELHALAERTAEHRR